MEDRCQGMIYLKERGQKAKEVSKRSLETEQNGSDDSVSSKIKVARRGRGATFSLFTYRRSSNRRGDHPISGGLRSRRRAKSHARLRVCEALSEASLGRTPVAQRYPVTYLWQSKSVKYRSLKQMSDVPSTRSASIYDTQRQTKGRRDEYEA